MGKLHEIMDPTSIFTMKDVDITRIAAETEESRAARAELETKLKVLSSGSEICKTFAALYVNGKAGILSGRVASNIL